MHPPGVSIGAHYAIKGATDGVLVADGVDGEKVVVRSVLGDGGEWEKGPAHTSVGNVNQVYYYFILFYFSFFLSGPFQTCLIVHYYLQSLEDCYKRKIFRPRLLLFSTKNESPTTSYFLFFLSHYDSYYF